MAVIALCITNCADKPTNYPSFWSSRYGAFVWHYIVVQIMETH